jgi:hypothetical protein
VAEHEDREKATEQSKRQSKREKKTAGETHAREREKRREGRGEKAEHETQARTKLVKEHGIAGKTGGGGTEGDRGRRTDHKRGKEGPRDTVWR